MRDGDGGPEEEDALLSAVTLKVKTELTSWSELQSAKQRVKGLQARSARLHSADRLFTSLRFFPRFPFNYAADN